MGILRFLLKAIMNFLIVVLLLAICIVGLAIWSFPKLAPKAIDNWIEGKTGFSTVINEFDVKLFSGIASINGMRLLNPPYYQRKQFIDIRQIEAKVVLGSLYKEELVVDYLVIDVEKITWVEDKNGNINIIEFANSFKKKGEDSTNESSNDSQVDPRKRVSNKRRFIIKKFIVKLGQLDVVGFPDGGDTVQNFAINYNKEFVDVRDFKSVAKEIRKDMTIYGIGTFASKLLTTPMQDTINSGVEAVGAKVNDKITKEIQRGVNKILKSLKKSKE